MKAWTMQEAPTAIEESRRHWDEFVQAMSFRMLPGNLPVLHSLRPLAQDGNSLTLGTAYAEEAEAIEQGLLPRLRLHLDEFFPGMTFRVRPLDGDAELPAVGGRGDASGQRPWASGQRRAQPMVGAR
jgi:hypothetical protein